MQGKWRAWVPIYNSMIFSKLGDLSPWLVLIAIGASLLLSWVPVLGWVISIASYLILLAAAWRVGLKLQKEAVWVIRTFFLAPVWLGINAFDRSRWNTAIPAAPWASNSFLADSTQWAGIPSQTPAGGFPPNPATSGYAVPPAGHHSAASRLPAARAAGRATSPRRRRPPMGRPGASGRAAVVRHAACPAVLRHPAVGRAVCGRAADGRAAQALSACGRAREAPGRTGE